MERYWEIEEGKVYSAKFFEALPKYFPEATTFFAEGTSISDDVKECYVSNREDGKHLPGAQTIFPISNKYRCKFSCQLMTRLAALAEIHAELELLDHLALYQGDEELLFWHDAFSNVLLVSRTVPESIVSKFTSELHLNYGRSATRGT